MCGGINPENGNILAPGIKKIHFIGIGGISMSGLAEILAGRGYCITGSDMKESENTLKLNILGIETIISHSEDNIKDPDLVVYTAAVREDNPELSFARKRGLKVIDRAELLGLLTVSYEKSIAVSGTHGKTTTTSMIASILLKAGVDPSIHIGGVLKEINGSVRPGNSDYFVTEACEYCDSFLKLKPLYALILNCEYDHADYFKSMDQLKNSFINFANGTKSGGTIILNADDSNAFSILPSIKNRVILYGLDCLHGNDCHFRAVDITFDRYGCASYTVLVGGNAAGRIELGTAGRHNVSNSLAALATCLDLGIPFSDAAFALKAFTGTGRRYEKKGEYNSITVIDDYAHHPTEIKATLKAARAGNFNEIWCIFQPHTYTRTKALLDEFIDSFGDADHVILADIYAARENNPGGISSKDIIDGLLRKGKHAVYIDNFEDISVFVKNRAKTGDLILTMGAGDIDTVASLLLKEDN